MQVSNATRDTTSAIGDDDHSDELAKQVMNLTPIVSSILSNLHRLDDATVSYKPSISDFLLIWFLLAA